MRLDEVKVIIANEKLTNYNLYMNGIIHRDEVVIFKKDGNWLVGITDERAQIISGTIHSFETEEEANDDFIDRVRGENEILKLRKELFGH